MTTNIAALGNKRRPPWTWADRVRKVRRDLGLTQAEFAALTGYGEKAIAAWEAGRNTPEVSVAAVALEVATGVDKLWWIGWVDNGPAPDPDTSRRPNATNSDLLHSAVIVGPWSATPAQSINAA